MDDDIIGRVVISKAGRDMRRSFVVVGIADEGHLLIADGQTHRLDRPKKKKLKHLRFENSRLDVCDKLGGETGVTDAFIRKGLLNLGYNHDSEIEEG
ncbi:MAG: KOW domain-containing RNA-binding protein [Clostridia bacterium]